MMTKAERMRALRAMVAERGIDSLMTDISDLCYDASNRTPISEKYQELWLERARDFAALSLKFSLTR